MEHVIKQGSEHDIKQVGNHDNKQASKHGGSMVVNATSTMELKFEQRIERAIKHEIKDRKRVRISARN
jgi:hypothetical protein